LNKVATLPNIIKKFNPNLKGFSTKPTFVLAAKEGAGFNAAVSGNKAYHIIDQARILLDRMKQSKEINFEQDWKMVTLFIGGNDLCGVCKNKTLHSPQQYIDDIKDALGIFKNYTIVFFF
jgi:phospholipase B1